MFDRALMWVTRFHRSFAYAPSDCRPPVPTKAYLLDRGMWKCVCCSRATAPTQFQHCRERARSLTGFKAAIAAVLSLVSCENPQPPLACGPILEQQLHVGETTTVLACFDDPNDEPLAYAAETSDPRVATATASGNTVAVEGVAPGTALATVTATDPVGLQAQERFHIIVPNRAPVPLGVIPESRIPAGDSATLDVSGYFREPDGQALEYTATASDTSVAKVSGMSSVLTVTARSKGSATVNVTGTDPGGLTAMQSFAVNVPNRTPASVDSIPALTVIVGDSVTQALVPYFRDPDGDSLTYTATSSDVDRVAVAVSDGSVLVAAIAKGTVTVAVTATDTEGLSATQEFAVVVPNRSPVAVGVIPGDTIEAEDSETIRLAPYFSDPDGDHLTLAATASDTSVIRVSVSGVTLTVAAVAKGSAVVTVTATDTEGVMAQQEFSVTVPNRRPLAVGVIPADTIRAGEAATLEPSGYFADPDGDELVYEVTVSDAAMITAVVENGTVTMTAIAKGKTTVAITAIDTEGLSATQGFTVTVPNRGPSAVGMIPGATVEAGEVATIELAPYFSDPDADPLTFSATVSDAAVAGVSVSGTTLAVAATAKGEVTVTVTATDTEGLSTTQEFAVTVPNRKPLAVGTVPAETVAIGEATTLALSGYFTDPDGDPLTFVAAVSDSTVLTAAAAGGRIALTGIAKGRVTVTTTATDTEGLWATQEFPVTVPNRAPVIEISIPPHTLQAGEVATLKLSSFFSDPDGDPVIFAATASDTSVAAVSVSGEVLAVAADTRGKVTVTVTATDTEGLSTAQKFAVTVPNRGPSAMGAIPADTVAAGEVTTLDLSGYFTDPDGDPLTFAATVSDSAVAGFSVAGAVLAVTAIAKGNAVLTVTATDTEGLSTAQKFAVTVPNRGPSAMGAIPADTVAAGEVTTLDLSGYFTDPDGDPLTFAATVSDSAVAGFSVAGAVLAVTAIAKGNAVLTVTATDTEGLSTAQKFAVTVPNRGPSAVGATPADTVAAGEVTTLDLSGYFTDPDGDPLTFAATVSDSAVAGFSVAGAVLAVTAIAKGNAVLTVTAIDTEGLSTAQKFAVTVPNRGPSAVGAIPADTVAAGEVTTLDLSGYFTDPDGDPLTFAATVSDSAVAGFSVAGAVLAVTAIAKGNAVLTVTAIDTEGLTATHGFNVTVPNRPPLPVGPIQERTIEVGGTATLELSSHFTDPDGDILAFKAAVSDTTVARISASGTALTISAVARGEATVTITAADPEGLMAVREFAVTVPGRAPLPVGTLPPLRVTKGGIAKVGPPRYFTDPDGDTLVFEVASSDLEVAKTWVSRSTVLVRAVGGGTATVTITARDPDGLTATQQFDVQVSKGSKPNRPPKVVGSIVEQKLEEGDSRTLRATAYFSDPDGDKLRFRAGSTDDSVATTTVSGTEVTIESVAKGSATITITARDPGGLTASLEFDVTVSKASEENRAPVVVGTIAAKTLEEGDSMRIDAAGHFSDPDGDELVFKAGSSDDGVARTIVSGAKVTIESAAEGTATITITARDPDGLTASLDFGVTVSEPPEDNRAPVVVGTIPAKTLEEGDSMRIDATDHFSDPDGDELVFKAGSSDDGVARTIVSGAKVTIESAAEGTATITITARDPDGLTASLDFGVTVSEPPEDNRAPVVVEAIPAKTLEEGDSMRIDATGHFSDPDGDELVFKAGSSDDGVATTTVSGAEVTIESVATGSSTITITARDPDGLTASLEFDVTVSKASEENRAPVVVGTIPAKTLEEGDSMRIDATDHFSDPDDDELVFKAGSSDDGVAKTIVSGAKVTIASVAEGTATITVTARDPDGLTASQDFGVTVSEPPEDNRAPVVVEAIPAKILEKGDSMRIDVAGHFSDPDGDKLVFKAKSSDSEVVTARVTDATLTVTAAATGSATVSITAEDPEPLSARLAFDVTVEPPSPKVSICSRTLELREMILKLTGADSCQSVSSNKLARVSHLKLASAGIASLKSGDFGGLSGLTILELFGNDLSVLPSDVFSGLSSLTELQLSYNSLGSLHSNVFSGLTSLVQLNVSHNGLTTLPADVLSGLTSLRYLFLDGNDITVLPPDIFSDLSSLFILFLYGNDFTTLPSSVFSGLDSLHLLTMEGGALTTLPAGTFSGLASLTKLDLANNRLSTLPSNVLAGASGLEELLLSGNELKELPDSLFHGLSSLEALWLHGNDVDPMPVEVSLISVGNGKVKATVSAGAPFAIEIPLIVTNGTIDGDSTITIPAGSVESATFTVTPGEGGATLDVGTLPDHPKDRTVTSYWFETHTAHYGYKLKRSPDLPLTVNEQ